MIHNYREREFITCNSVSLYSPILGYEYVYFQSKETLKNFMSYEMFSKFDSRYHTITTYEALPTSEIGDIYSIWDKRNKKIITTSYSLHDSRFLGPEIAFFRSKYNKNGDMVFDGKNSAVSFIERELHMNYSEDNYRCMPFTLRTLQEN